MKRVVILFIILSLAFTLIPVNANSSYIPSNGMMIEAEDCQFTTSYKKTESSDASGGAYIKDNGVSFSETVSSDTPPEISFSVNSDGIKKYALWMRSDAASVNNDSIYWTINSLSYRSNALSKGGYKWNKLGVVTLVNGENTVKFHHRETGLIIDKFMLCELRYKPEGLGELPDSQDDYKVENPYDKPDIYPEDGIHPKLFITNRTKAEIDNKIDVIKSVLPKDASFYEAEDHLLSTNKYFNIYRDAYTGNGKYVMSDTSNVNEIINNPDTTGDIKIEYSAENDGKYAVWVKAKAISSSSDSFFYKVNQNSWEDCPLSSSYYGQWRWVKVGNFDFKKGINTVELLRREGYTGIDRIMICNDTQTPMSDIAIKEEYPSLQYVYDGYIQLNAFKNSKVTAKYNSPENWDQKNYNTDHLEIIIAKSFFAYMEGDSTLAHEAYNAIINFIDTANFPDNNIDALRNAGYTVFTGALVYDWCYNFYTAEQLNNLRVKLLDLQTCLETGYPPNVYSSVSGHMGEHDVLRDTLCLSIAIYDEDNSLYEMTAGGIFQHMTDWYNYMYESGYHSQGDSYGHYRYMCELIATEIFYAMGYDNVFNRTQKDIAYQQLYFLRPDGLSFRDGDSYMSGRKIGSQWGYQTTYMLAASMYKDEYLNSQFYDMYLNNEKDPMLPNIYSILFSDISLGMKDKSSLPLTRYFDEPSGAMIARTGWNDGLDSSDAVAFFKVGTDYFGGHQHMDSGQFQLYYKGGLAVETGVYELYGNAHDVNYNKRTIAHNTMLIYNPEEKISVANDGGQRFIVSPSKLSDMQKDEYKLGEVLEYGYGPDEKNPVYSYLKGDITKAYSSEKLENFDRSFMFINNKDSNYPATVLIFDKVNSKNASFKKSWLLNTPEKPEVNGNTAVMKRTSNGYNGKLLNTTVYPKGDNLDIKVTNKEDLFIINGKDYSDSYTGNVNTTHEGTGYRISVSPKSESTEDYFLNVMQVMDNDDSLTGMPVTSLETNSHIGAKVGDTKVLFAKDDSVIDDTVSCSLSENENVIITGVKSGIWNVINDDGVIETKVAVNDDKVLYFASENGDNYTFKYAPSLAENVTMFVPEGFYDGINSHNGFNAFYGFCKLSGIEKNIKVIDYGMIFGYGKLTDINLESQNIRIASVKEEFLEKFKGKSTIQYGILFYGAGLKKNNNYSIKPYIVFEENGVRYTKYGETRTKLID